MLTLHKMYTCLAQNLAGVIFLHTQKYFRNLIKLNQNYIVFTIFRLIWSQTDVRLVQNQSENGKYNLILGWFNKFQKKNSQYLDRIVVANECRKKRRQDLHRHVTPSVPDWKKNYIGCPRGIGIETEAQLKDPLNPSVP